MGRKSSKTGTSPPVYHEAPGCFNGIWNGAVAEGDDTPVIARKSLSERKFSEGFEAPRNSLDIGSAVFESARSNASVIANPAQDEIPFGFEFALKKSLPPRVSVQSSSGSATESGRCRSPSVIARLMGLDTLPAEQPARAPLPKQQQESNTTPELQAWKLLSERRELLSSRSTNEHRGQEKRHFFSRQLSSSRLENEDEFLLFDVLPFRDHPQEKQLEKLKQEFQARRQTEDSQSSRRRTSHSAPELLLGPPSSRRTKPEPKEMREAIQFLQSNKESLVKFLQDPNSVFAKHIYDLQALAAKESGLRPPQPSTPNKLNPSLKSPSGTAHQDNIGFSRRLVESKRDQSPKVTPSTTTRSTNNNNNPSKRKESDVVQRQRKDSPRDRIILLKPNLKKQSTSAPCPGTAAAQRTKPDSETTTETSGLRRSRSFKDVVDINSSLDPRALARQIARQVRENVDKELLHGSWSESSVHGGGECSEPSSRRYSREFQVPAQVQSSGSLPSSPKLGRKAEKVRASQSEDESLFIQIEVTKDSARKPKSGKLLKLFAKDKEPQKTSSSSDHSPRLLVRSKSVPGFVEEKSESHDALERTHSCKQSTSTSSSRVSPSPESSNSKGKFSSLKSSLLGGRKKSGSHRTDGTGSSKKSQDSCKQIEHSVSVGYEDPYTRTFRETEAQLASTYGGCQPESNKFTFDPVSPSYLSVDIIGQGLDHLDASSDIHMEKSEQPSPVSVLERGFIEESPSPVSFEDGSSDLQELQMRLERLKLDESGRTYNPERADDGSPSPSSSPSPYAQDHVYIAKLIQASGFDKSMSSLYNWHSPMCPMDPFLFGKVEEEYSSCETPSAWQGKGRGSRTNRKLKIGRKSAQVERRPETLHRQMVFDVVNEVLSRKFEHLWNEQPWHEIGRAGMKTMASGKYLVREVVREVEVFRHEYDKGEYLLENLVERDVKRGGGSQWMDSRDELRKITAQVEESILDGLVEELAASLNIGGESP